MTSTALYFHEHFIFANPRGSRISAKIIRESARLADKRENKVLYSITHGLREFAGICKTNNLGLSMRGEMSGGPRESQVFAEFSPDFHRIFAYLAISGPILGQIAGF